MSASKRALCKAKKENQKNRNVDVNKKKVKIENILYGEFLHENNKGTVEPENLLINGDEYKRTAVLRTWMDIFHGDKDLAEYPVIYIGKSDAFLSELDFPEDITLIGRDAKKRYDPFLSMKYDTVKELLQQLDSGNAQRLDTGAWDVFKAVWSMLEKNGFETSLGNLSRIYGEKMLGENVAGMLEKAGYGPEAMRIKENTQTFTNLKTVIQGVRDIFEDILAPGTAGISFLDEVKRASEQRTDMPIFYFVIPSLNRNKYLDYLAGELKSVSEYATPVLILDSMAVNPSENAGNYFHEYILHAQDLCLTVAANDCTALLAEDDFRNLLGYYNFAMVLAESRDTVEKITEHLGKYRHILVEESGGTGREWLKIFPRDVNSGFSTGQEDRLRIRGEDLRALGKNGILVCSGLDIIDYQNVRFD